MRLSLLAAAALLASSVAARADTVYTYTGSNFTYAVAPFTTSDSITGTVTLATPLADNLNAAGVTPSTFSFYDGVDSFTPANTLSQDEQFSFSTDANGNITQFQFVIVHVGSDNFIQVSTLNGNYSQASSTSGNATNFDAGGSFSSGVTTTAAVTPEPSSLALLGTGILGVFGVMKRRFA